MSNPSNIQQVPLKLLRAALDLEPSQWRAFLQPHCADLAQCEALLAMLHSQAQADAAAVEPDPALAPGELLRDALATQAGSGGESSKPTPGDSSLPHHLAQAGQRVGAFRTLHLLGRGGMGEVWLAERVDGFAQKVAIKWARGGGQSAEQLARFEQERALLATLDHAGIARLIDGGVEADALWFAMEYVPGEQLSAIIKTARLSLAVRLDVMLQLCDAVHYAHQRLIVHRDLKPANVIVDSAGRARLLDFGIAKRLDDAPELTQNASPLTILYAAPEQIRGATISTATDVYALGAVFYELLCGQRPHEVTDGDRLALLEAITGKDPLPPSARVANGAAGQSIRAAQLKGDLDTIVLKALAREPTRRYGSALALADDIRAYLKCQPIAARPDSNGYRIGKLIQRNRLSATMAGIALVAVIAGGVFATVQARLSARAEADALEQARQAESVVEHMASVLNRAQSEGETVATQRLFDWAADPNLSGIYDDPAINRALNLAISDLMLVRADFTRLLAVLDTIAPTLKDASPREQLHAANNRARAQIGLGQYAQAQQSLDEAQRLRPESSNGQSARTQLFLGQLLLQQGKTQQAAAAALAAAREVEAARDLNPLLRGQLLTNCAVGLLQAGELAAANRYALRAIAIWQQGKVQSNASLAGARNVAATAAFLLGDIQAALTQLDEIATLNPGEAPIAAQSRAATYAKALALKGEGERAVKMVSTARELICAQAGERSSECQRITLSAVDTSLYANDLISASAFLQRAERELNSAPVPVLQTSATLLRLRLLAMRNPDQSSSRAWISAIQASDLSGLARRNAVRALLIAAEQMAARKRPEIAGQFARTAIDLAAALPETTGGLDQTLLQRWRLKAIAE